MENNISLGKKGEIKAKEFLVEKGFTILETNYRNKIGEIDIIALDGNVLVFIEVKTRTGTTYGYAYEAVGIRKQKKIINVSRLYLTSKHYYNVQIRYDIIEVYLTNKIVVNHLENAFCLN